MISGCAEKLSYGSVSRSGKTRTATLGPAKKATSSLSASASRLFGVMTMSGPAALAAASAMASAAAAPYSRPHLMSGRVGGR